jgi:hypothetical protein
MKILIFFILCFSISIISRAQTNTLYYFDLHSHITMKNFDRKYPFPLDYYKNPNKADNNYYNTNYKGSSTDANFKNFDQATFPQLINGKFSVVITSITPLERNSVVSKFGKINLLKSIGMLLSTKLTKKSVYGLYNTSSFKTYLAEYQFLKNEVTKNSNNFIIVDNYNQMKIKQKLFYQQRAVIFCLIHLIKKIGL